MAYIKWTKEEDELIKKLTLQNNISFKDFIEFLPNRTKKAIITRCYFLGYKNKYKPRKYSFNENYFKIKTLENCYFAGVIMADGCICMTGRKNKYPTFTWQVAEKDKGLLDLFSQKINSTYELKSQFVQKNNKFFKNYKLCISNCLSWKDDLERNFGIIPHKTYRVVPQNFDNLEQELAFLIGLLDGDGSISTWGQKQIGINIQICSSSLPIIEWVKKITDKLNLPSFSNRNNNIYKPDNENCYYYTIRGVTAAFLFERLKSIDVPKLDRKWNNPVVLDIIEKLKLRWENKKALN